MDSKLNPDGSEMPKWLQGKPWSELPTKSRVGFQGRNAVASIELRQISGFGFSRIFFVTLMRVRTTHEKR